MALFVAARKLADTARRKGAFAVLRVTLNRLRLAVIHHSPARRRARREAADFDRRHGTDTAGLATVDSRLANAEHAVRYQASGREELEAIFDALPVDLARFTFVDVGSGKGRALLFASHRPFARVVGIEFSPALHAIAVANAAAYRSPEQQCRRIEPLLGDAATAALPPGPLVVYLYNPFSPALMTRFVENLRRSLVAAPRETWVVYLNPVARACFDSASWLRRTHETEDWLIYRAWLSN